MLSLITYFVDIHKFIYTH